MGRPKKATFRPKKRHSWVLIPSGQQCKKCGITVRYDLWKGPKGGAVMHVQVPPTRGFIQTKKIPPCTGAGPKST